MSEISDMIQRLCPDGVEYRKIKDTVGVNRGSRLTKSQLIDDGIYEVYHGSKDTPLGRYNHYNAPRYSTIVVNTGGIGGVKFLDDNFWCSDGSFWLGQVPYIEPKYLYYCLSGYEDYFYSKKRVGGVPTIDRAVVEDFEIPVPPLEVQRKIVEVLDNFSELTAELTAELEARKKQYEYYRDNLLNFNRGGQNVSDVKWMTLQEMSTNCDRLRKPIASSKRVSGNIPYYGASGIVDYVQGYTCDGDFLLISEDGANLLTRTTPIAFSISGKNWVNNHAHVISFENQFTRRFVEYYFNSISLEPYITGGAQPKLNQENLNRILIPIPPLAEQERIVSILDRFEALTTDLTAGLPAEIKARQQQYEYYRDQLLTFKRAN